MNFRRTNLVKIASIYAVLFNYFKEENKHIEDLDTINYQYEKLENALIALQSAIIKKLEELGEK